MSKTNTTTKNRRVGIALTFAAVGMLGLSFASVPLYKLFCQVTGYGGTPKIGEPIAQATGDAIGHKITVTLDANVNPALKWDFKARVHNIDVALGEETLAIYSARNMGSEAVTGTAVFNVTPFKAAQYVSKIDCFCFTEQRLNPGEEMPMPVSFYIDPEILNDPDTEYLENIILSYTFFPSRKAAEAESGADEING
ncbi:MAG: cytochrome c oxidase assembly protein [Rhodospirillales bacterium]|jgi:cytochrome c oxidase assembly protein subunit 11|nr:cytochrome c oxidase assembly protein [Rhodospirillales bacterium]MBT4040157.1 cytochrome c oxidase assembly protein [Rhodospirillales bacterium]MBT4625749.1 cytochrome c oxidase assembly protein [Rhodospirillales bacterium]MBT5352653.1 cytochrome c oxidase assembly protein [Rhodospirillales bacterium]MBT5521711.1 cytochrome c oxidase assembly protein [Rhodospirillales bacterium]